ncbi:MAG: alpha/beta hydrolase [Moraxellaceae bacterium]
MLFILSATASLTHAAAADVNPVSSNGISVITSSWINPRLLDVTVTSALLNRAAGVRALLPASYAANPTKRYPVIYLFHGGGGSYADWTTWGNIEALTASLDVIVIMPDGGKGSWYSDFDNFGLAGAPQWERFEITQLIPWVDANLRTQASRSGRAIAGLSMGGYGAMSYAARHPDLFVSASSFSGAVNTGLPAFNAYIAVSPVIDGFAPGAIWGVPPLDQTKLHERNPTELAANLRGMHVGLYAGNGAQGPLDGNFEIVGVFNNIQEGVVEQMNLSLSRALTQAGVSHTLNTYGNGTHSWPYWNRDLQQEMPAIMATFANPQAAGNAIADADFEASGKGPWICGGQCGVDHGLGNAQTGTGNGWVRNNRGWNDIHQTVQVAANTPYRLTGWLRTSTNSDNGFFGVRTGNGTVISEQSFTRLNGYTKVSVLLNSGNNTSVVVYGGVWTDHGDIWLQLDNVSLTPEG